MNDAVIQVENVWKKFRKGEVHDSLRELIPALFKRLTGRKPPGDELQNREFWALRDVSFEVKRGESLGIIGPNGAGKSTMLKLLSRILKPNRGSYKVNGRISALIEVGAGFHPDLTGRENIFLNGTILGMKRKEIKTKEKAIIDFAGIEDFIDTPVKRYSSGMGARLGFSIAAHMEPDVLLVDEVLSVGDARFRDKCVRHMHRLLKSNVTVVFISHILDQVRELCEKTIVLNQGQIVHNGDTNDAIRLYLDLLSKDEAPDQESESAETFIRNIRTLDMNGDESLEWRSRQPRIIECDLIVRRPLGDLTVLLNLETISNTYISTAATHLQNVALPSLPGTYRLRFTIDPMPLADGEFRLMFKVFDLTTDRCVWAQAQPRNFSVRGSGVVGPLINLTGQWQVRPLLTADAATEAPGRQEAIRMGV